MTVHDLAVLCGVHVPYAKIMALSSYGHTFLSKRFDRDSASRRFHFMSVMTAPFYADRCEATGWLMILLSYATQLFIEGDAIF